MPSMELTLLKAKLHRATVTQCDLDYEGSITIDTALLEQSGILPYEQVDVLNVNNGARFTTYAIRGERDTGIIGVNGAAARLCQPRDQVIICTYARMDHETALVHKPTVLTMNADNSVKAVC